jgi:predicted dehydrogenase
MREPSRRRFLTRLSGSAAALALPARAWAAPPDPPSGRKLGFALVGLGSLSKNQLAPAFQNATRCRLAGLVSGHRDKAEAWAQQYGVPTASIYNYETFDRVASNPDVDVVYVVLPNSMHAEYTIRALRAGKHVLCEKPMAVSVKECEDMIAAARAAKRLLAIGYRLHFEPHNLEMRRLARERTLGALKAVEASGGFRIGDPTQWRLDRALSGGGSLMDIGIYALQAARYITGEEPDSVSAHVTITDPVKFKDLDETTVFSLTFPSGVVANCTSSYATGLNRFWAGAERGWFELSPALSYTGLRGRRSDGQPMEFPQIDQFAAEMDNLAQCIVEGRPTRVPGEEGLRDLRIMTAIYEAAASGKTVKLG